LLFKEFAAASDKPNVLRIAEKAHICPNGNLRPIAVAAPGKLSLPQRSGEHTDKRGAAILTKP
jgi:hypothetical protein